MKMKKLILLVVMLFGLGFLSVCVSDFTVNSNDIRLLDFEDSC